MFEKLKSLFCIHRFVIAHKIMMPEGLHLCMMCEKCGEVKHNIIK